MFITLKFVHLFNIYIHLKNNVKKGTENFFEPDPANQLNYFLKYIGIRGLNLSFFING